MAAPTIEAHNNTSLTSPIARISSPQTLSYNFSPVGANPILFVTWVDGAFDNGGSSGTISATWNGTSMTSVSSNTGRTAGFYLINPVDTGTHNVVVSWTVGTARCFTAAATVTGAAQSSPIDVSAVNTNIGGPATVSGTTVTANTLLIDYDAMESSGPNAIYTADSPQTALYINSSDSNGIFSGSSWKTAATAGSQTMSWTRSGSDTSNHVEAAFAAIKPFVAPASNSNFLMFM